MLDQINVGRFMCELGDNPEVVATDEVRMSQFDVRQDAATRAFVAMRKRGVAASVIDEDFPSALDEHRDLAFGALKYAVGEAKRTLHGRSQQGSRLLRTLSLPTSSDYWHADETEAFYGMVQAVHDVWTEGCFERIESEDRSELEVLYDEATPDVQLAIKLMCEAQKLQTIGVQIPNAMRSQLKRLRKSTGLPLTCENL